MEMIRFICRREETRFGAENNGERIESTMVVEGVCKQIDCGIFSNPLSRGDCKISYVCKSQIQCDARAEGDSEWNWCERETERGERERVRERKRGKMWKVKFAKNG